MAKLTVKQFADTVGTPVERLLTQLKESGVDASGPDYAISDEEKMKLLAHLRGGASTAAPKKVTLKRRSTSELKTVGAQGKARTVNVEVRKKRTYIKRGIVQEEAEARQQEVAAEVAEREAAEAAKRANEEQSRAAIQAEREAEARKLEEVAAKKKAAEEAAKKEAEAAAAAKQQQAAAVQARAAAEVTEKAKERGAPAKKRDGKPARGRGKPEGRTELHIAGDKSGRRKKKSSRHSRAVKVQVDNQHVFEKPTAPVIKEVEIPEMVSVSDLAQKMAVKGTEVIKTLMGMGAMVTINQIIDQDTATLVVEEMGHTPKPIEPEDLETQLLGVEDDNNGATLAARPPVVTIMGHVDHGKTSLLDYIRRTRIAAGEAGGITQHIGAYHVTTESGHGISFLDTPGHAAFTAMRARGAEVTDIVILVVAADDGVMPQTEEAVRHAKAAGVPLIVAVNKMDKENADPDRVKNELSQYEVIPEDWGGDTQFVNVSALTGAGVDELLEALVLQAEVLELTASAEGNAKGAVVESSLEKGRGAVATVLVQSGTLRKGDMLLCGREYGRVRAMFDETGTELKTAGPSMPVAVLGLSGVPEAGDEAMVVANERKAREVADLRQTKQREDKLKRQQAAKLENLFAQMQSNNATTLNVLVKADVQGSAEALSESLTKLSNEEVRVNVVANAVGGITESDANLAMASSALIIGFNVRADNTARRLIQEEELEIHYFSVIYEAIDLVKNAISGMMKPEVKENILGLAEVREVFRSSSHGPIAGCLVVDGVVKRDKPIRVLRDNVVIYEGELESLRRFKDIVAEVQSGTECGIGVKNYNDVQPKDQIECFERFEIARSL